MQNILNMLVAQTDWAILILRIALGVIFMAHGWNKIKDFKGTIEWFGKWGFKPASMWAVAAIGIQFIGGLLLVVGLWTQLVAVILALEMIIATLFNLKRKEPFFEVLEFDIILLATLLLLTTLGAGQWTIL